MILGYAGSIVPVGSSSPIYMVFPGSGDSRHCSLQERARVGEEAFQTWGASRLAALFPRAAGKKIL
jgi:hypothetical protein